MEHNWLNERHAHEQIRRRLDDATTARTRAQVATTPRRQALASRLRRLADTIDN